MGFHELSEVRIDYPVSKSFRLRRRWRAVAQGTAHLQHVGNRSEQVATALCEKVFVAHTVAESEGESQLMYRRAP